MTNYGTFKTFWGGIMDKPPPVGLHSLMFDSVDALFFWLRYGCTLDDLWAD